MVEIFMFYFFLQTIEIAVTFITAISIVCSLTLTQLALKIVSVVEWLEHRGCDQHCLGSKSTPAILLCSWETFSALSLLGGHGKQF